MLKKKLEIFDRPMCCSSGVCGANVDSELSRFAGDLQWLKSRDIEVARYNLSSEPAAFTGNADIRQLLQDQGQDVLPVIVVNGNIETKGGYPARAELANLLGLSSENDTRVGEESTGCGPCCNC